MIGRSKLWTAIFLVQAFPLAASPQAEPIEIPAPVEKIFVPTGFDDNDNSEVVVHGDFRNSCYRVGKISSSVDQEKFTINVTATSLEYRGNTCLQVMVPFTQQLKLGVLKSGTYNLIVNTDKSVRFIVKPSLTDSADDYFYAPVTYAEIVRDPRTNNQLIEIRGHYPLLLHGCAIVDDIKVIRNEDNVVAILPIMRFLDGSPCNNHSIKFKVYAGLDSPFQGEGLLHVRSMNGNSYNQFVNVD